MKVMGFDIGGTKCAVMLAEVDSDKVSFLDRKAIPTSSDWHDVLDALSFEGEQMLSLFSAEKEGFRIGISCGGPLDAEKGMILSPPNLPGWDNVPITAFFRERFGVTAILQNDADACALAEWRYGAGRGTNNMVFLTFGTGLGAGLILNGKLYRGTNGMAGEVGHIRLKDDGPVGYGKSGSFEGFCSGGGIRQLAQRKAEMMVESGQVPSYLYSDIASITTKDVALAAEKGHEDALEVFRISGAYFGKGLSVLIDILNPETIVVGSIFTRSGKFLTKTMEEELEKEALPQSRKVCRIVPAELGEAIGDYGAIVTAMD